MKTMKIRLADGEIYEIATFTLRQTRAIQKIFDGIRKQRKTAMNELPDDDTPLTDEQSAQLESLQDQEYDQMVNVARMSLAKKHPQFAAEAVEAVEAANNTVEDLVDIDSLEKIVEFSLTGNVTDEQQVVYEFV